MAPQAVVESAHGAPCDALFRAADRDGDSVVSGVEAHRFFARLEPALSQRALARVWALADQRREGFLTRESFGVAMRLVAQAQRGATPTLEARALSAQPPDEVPTFAARGAPTPAAPPPPPRAGDAAGSATGAGPSGGSVTAVLREWRSRASATKPRAPPLPSTAARSISDGLAALYAKKVRPAEEAFAFGAFSDSPPLENVDFAAKPLVLLLGQYSCGKTTFITHLLGRSFPLAVIGPEPTTDRFCVVHHGYDERSTPGHTLATQRQLPFGGLQRFGTSFLNKLVGSELPAELLESVTLVDTPGVLSGEKQRLDRHYDFAHVSKWFAERADLILLLFDPHKLDISDEFRAVIASLRGQDDKVRVVLNKANSVAPQQLMRVYGALLWALSRVIRTPEVPRIYVGNFPAPDAPPPEPSEFSTLLQAEREDLMHDLRDIPRAALGRKVNEFVKRVRAVRLHCLLMGRLRERMPRLLGRERKQAKLLAQLPDVYADVAARHGLALGDFPPLDDFRARLSRYKLADFPLLEPKMLRRLDEVLSEDVPALLRACGNPFDAERDA